MWLRLYHDLPDDEKMDGFTDQQKWLWVVLMCMASRAPVRGTLRLTLNVALPIDSITKRTQMSPEAIQEAMQAFSEREMLHREDGVWVLTNWDKRQYESDNSSKRTKTYRDRKKQSGDATVTSQARHRDAAVTPSDTDSDADSDSDSSAAASGGNAGDLAAEWQRLKAWLHSNCGKGFTDTKIEHRWLPHLQDMGTDAIRLACEEAALHGASDNPAYTLSILASWQTKGVHSLEDAQGVLAAKRAPSTQAGRQHGRPGSGGALDVLAQMHADALAREAEPS